MKKVVISAFAVLVSLLFSGADAPGNAGSPASGRPAVTAQSLHPQIRYETIQPTDSDAVKQMKTQKNDLLRQGGELETEWNAKMLNGTATAEDSVQYKKLLSSLADQIAAIGLPPASPDADEEFTQNIDLYISDQYIAGEGQADGGHDVALGRMKALQQLKKDYQSGKISAQDALSSMKSISSGR